MLVRSLRAAGREDLADKVSGCHKSFNGWECKHGHRWAKAEKSCRIRLCAFEMRARAMRSLHRMEEPLSQLERARYLVLTQRNVPLGSLADGIARLFNSFERLRHRKVWQRVRAAVVMLEVTFNRQQKTWHPHLNVIFDGDFLPQKDLADNWRASTGGQGKIVWIEEAKGAKTALEVFKYVTKLADIADVPDAVIEFLAATRALRFLRTYGTLYRLPEEEEFELSCPDCGTHEVRRIGFVPFEAVSLDAQGVLRFDNSLLLATESPPKFDAGPPVPLTTWPTPVFPLSKGSCQPEVCPA